MAKHNTNYIKQKILEILEHPEADEGLHLRNFNTLHEVDERPGIAADDHEILHALNELIHEGKVIASDMDTETIFELAV